ncbi:MAG TPA: cell division protein ZapA [Holophagaceae bacterium]|jgi:cell division protein ZapA (FtsZ GTPase activity inhibitor)|nr:cell division protein ZapA [Holophagaceae bacterium]
MKPKKGPHPVRIEVLGRSLEVRSSVSETELRQAIQALESTFQDMDSACAVEWGHARPAADSSTWLILGALNLAHRVARLEREATQHTQDLEQTLKLLETVPDDIPNHPSSLFEGDLS